MSVDRSPRGYYQRDAILKRAMVPGTLGGEISNASPIDYGDVGKGAGASALIVAVSPAIADMFACDTGTLPADGAQDITLAHTPIPESVKVTIGGCPQINGDDFTLSGDVLSLVTTDGWTGMAYDVTYAYLTDVPDDTEIG